MLKGYFTKHYLGEMMVAEEFVNMIQRPKAKFGKQM